MSHTTQIRKGLFTLVFSCLLTLSGQATEPGTLVVLNKGDHTASILNAEDGELIATIATGIAPHEVAISPDGKMAAVGNYGDRQSAGNSISIIDLTQLKVVKTISLGEYTRPHGIRFLTPDVLIATAEAQQKIIKVSIKEEKVIAVISTTQRASHMVVLDKQQQMAYTANIVEGTVSKLNLKLNKLEKIFSATAGIEGIGISPDGTEVWVANRNNNEVLVMDAASGEITNKMPSPELPFRVEFSPDGGTVVVPNAVSGDLSVFNATTKELTGTIKISGTEWNGDTIQNPQPVGLIVGAAGKNVYVNCQGIGQVVSINLESMEIEGLFKAGNGPDGIGFSPLVLKP
ncbi:MAG: YncE family protein [Roseivirga sp.]|nr:YncE family protein [Roseivirga sp.]